MRRLLSSLVLILLVVAMAGFSSCASLLFSNASSFDLSSSLNGVMYRVVLVKRPSFESPTLRLRVSKEIEGHMSETPLRNTSIPVLMNDKAYTFLSSRSGEIEINLARDFKNAPSQPDDVNFVLDFPSQLSFQLSSRMWTRPFFVMANNSAGTIYAEKRSTSAKLGSFQGGDCFELVSPDVNGAWANIFFVDGRETLKGWVLSSAGSVLWLPKGKTSIRQDS